MTPHASVVALVPSYLSSIIVCLFGVVIARWPGYTRLGVFKFS
jgi:hypothetical protein